MIYMIYLIDVKMLYYDISMQGYTKVVFLGTLSTLKSGLSPII